MNNQMVTIEVAPATAALLEAQAVAEAITVDQLLQHLAGVGDERPTAAAPTPEERAAAFTEWVQRHAVKGVLADDSRERIYTREDDAV